MWIRRFILFHGKRHPSTMGADEVNACGRLVARRFRASIAALFRSQRS
jgi:hypothetical protein